MDLDKFHPPTLILITKPQETADLVIFTEEILDGKKSFFV